MHCKLDKMCSVSLFRLYRACVNLPIFSWYYPCGMGRYNTPPIMESSLPRSQISTPKAPGVLAARLNGRASDKPNA